MKLLLILIMSLAVYQPVPVVEPDADVPFNPGNATYNVVYKEKVDSITQISLELKVVDDANGLSVICSKGNFLDTDINDVNGTFEYTYHWSYTPDYGLSYIDFFFLDSNSLSEGYTAVINVPAPHINKPPVLVSIERWYPPEANEPNLPSMWISPDSVSDPNNTWQNEQNLIDGDPNTYAQSRSMGVPVEVIFDSPIRSDRLRINARFSGRGWKIEVLDSSGSSWVEVFSGFLDDGWTEINYAERLIERARISQIGGSINGSVREYEFGKK